MSRITPTFKKGDKYIDENGKDTTAKWVDI
jgi:hypothetical protein